MSEEPKEIPELCDEPPPLNSQPQHQTSLKVLVTRPDAIPSVMVWYYIYQSEHLPTTLVDKNLFELGLLQNEELKGSLELVVKLVA